MNDVRAGMVKFWKAVWANYVRTVTSMNDQGEKMLDLFFSHSENMQVEAKRLLKEALKNAQDAQMAFIKAFEDNLKKFEKKPNRNKDQ